jgi:hypothetical protein
MALDSFTENPLKRMRQRRERSADYLAGASWPRKLWGSAHVDIANTVDAAHSLVGNERLAAAWGGFVGAGRGALIGTFVGFGLTMLFPPAGAAFGSVLLVSAGIGALANGVRKSHQAYYNALERGIPKTGARRADNFAAEQGHALRHINTPERAAMVAEALRQVDAEEKGKSGKSFTSRISLSRSSGNALSR